MVVVLLEYQCIFMITTCIGYNYCRNWLIIIYQTVLYILVQALLLFTSFCITILTTLMAFTDLKHTLKPAFTIELSMVSTRELSVSSGGIVAVECDNEEHAAYQSCPQVFSFVFTVCQPW